MVPAQDLGGGMLIFHDQKLVFLSVPRTGSTAITVALRSKASAVLNHPQRLKHLRVRQYEQQLKPLLQGTGGGDYQTMAIVREPLDWLGSWYRYRQRRVIKNPEKSTSGISFDTFIQAYLRDDQPAFARIGSQAELLRGLDGQIGVDHLFRYEDQNGIKRFLESRLGHRIDLKPFNVSARKPLPLRPEMMAALQAARSEDFQLWDSLAPTGDEGRAAAE